MKRIVSILIVFILLSYTAFSASAISTDMADTGKTVVNYGDWIIEKINQDKQWKLDEYLGSDTEIITPRFIDDMMVVSFGDHCFANNTTVKSVVTSSPLWVIGDYAFNGCTALESFEFNFALHTIGAGAFSGTKSLTSINIEDSVLTAISSYAFADSGISDITLPETCERIGQYAFVRCDNLKRVFIPDSVTEIADNAFEDCDNLMIFCKTDSYAHKYAQTNSIPFILLDSTDTITFLLGDADGDDLVTISDVTLIQRVLAQLDEDPDGMIALRVTNGEEDLSIFDATTIQRYLAHLPINHQIGSNIIRSIA